MPSFDIVYFYSVQDNPLISNPAMRKFDRYAIQKFQTGLQTRKMHLRLTYDPKDGLAINNSLATRYTNGESGNSWEEFTIISNHLKLSKGYTLPIR